MTVAADGDDLRLLNNIYLFIMKGKVVFFINYILL